jgi:hypothetical protein
VVYLLIAVRRSAAWERLFCLAAPAALFGAFKLWARVVDWGFTSGRPEVEEAVSYAADAAPVAGVPGSGPLLWVLVGAAALAGAELGWWAARGRSLSTRGMAAAALSGVLLAAGAHQIGLTVMLLAIVLLLAPELFDAARAHKVCLVAGAVVLLLAAGWGLAMLGSGIDPSTTAKELAGRSVGRFLRLLLLAWPPAITVAAVAGAAWTLAATWRGRADPHRRFMLLVVLLVFSSRALLARKWTSRYLADVRPLWELLAGLAIVGAAVWLADRLAARGSRRAALAALAPLFVIALALTPGTRPGDIVAYLGRGPGEPPGPVRPVVGFTPDFRTVAEWLESRVGPDDRIVATDWLSTYCYTGRVDGWIRTRAYGRQSVLVDGVPRDMYIGAQVLPDRSAVERFAAAGTTWIVAGGTELTTPSLLAPEVRDWILTLPAEYVSVDGRTTVFRLEHGAEPPSR